MASQQTERCPSLEIGNDVLSQLIQAGLSGTEWSLTFAVIQQARYRGECAGVGLPSNVRSPTTANYR